MNKLLGSYGFVVLFFIQTLNAQSDPEHFYIQERMTEDNIVRHEQDTGNVNRVLAKHVIREYRYDSKGDIFEYQTERWRVKMETDAGIENYNKVYIDLNHAISLEEANATITNPGGTVVQMDKDDMVEENNFEEYGRLSYFALEGIEKGSIIEVDYTIRRETDYYGNRIIAQEDVPVYHFKFDLICPKGLIFSFLSIGTEIEIQKDTNDGERNHWTLELPYISAYADEPYANILPNLVSIYYKLDENKDHNRKGITSFTWAAQNVYEGLHPGISKGERKRLEKISKSLGISKMVDDEDKIRAMELFIKTEIDYLYDPGNPALKNIGDILEDKKADDYGMTKLLVNWLDLENINYEIAMTCDRFEQNFDREYESYSYLNYYLVYFPDTEAFVAPSNPLYRYGLTPYEVTNNYGLFIVPLKVGGYVTAYPKVKWIAASSSDESVDSTIYEVFLNDLEKPRVKTYKSLSGHEAAPFHGFMEHYSEEQKNELKTAFIKNLNDDEELISVETENDKEAWVQVKDLVFKGEILYPNLIGYAGENYLVNVGNLIGMQVELYQRKNRVNNISMQYNHTYDRTIVLNIPKGYVLKNLDGLNMDERYSIDGEEKMAFVSSFKLKEDKLVIYNREYYNVLELEKEHYEGFKRVINAAADFNKAVVVLSKE